MTNQLKAFLTALGIIFGVAAVISMMAIGKGAKQEILDQIKLVGVNNIVITPVIKQDNNSGESSSGNDQQSDKKDVRKFSKGLTLLDAEGIKDVVPEINKISPEIIIESRVLYNGKQKPVKIFGVGNTFFELFNLCLREGRFFDNYQLEHGLPVCIIGENVRSKLFDKVNPVGQKIKCGNVWLKVIGILEKRNMTDATAEKTGVSNSDNELYIPVRTMLLQFVNRSLITAQSLRGDMVIDDGFVMFNNQQAKNNHNQLDKLVVQVKETENINTTVEILNRYFLRRHSGIKDFEIKVPELLLKQQQRTKDIFNIVLGLIASISLIVGGIGIMNIMLASVLERIREIGIRQAIGATRKDISFQFIAESVLISLSGGFIGVLLGIIISKLVMKFAGILTIISPFSVLIAFCVSAAVGIIFGYVPAKRAAEKDPVESLRHE